MSLSSLYLDAFVEVARLKSFSQAAQKLNVTQSALSQRVLNLERDLGSSLFIRDPGGLKLTDLGQRLLRYCHSKTLLEGEFMESVQATDGRSLSGVVRVAGFSTVGRSVLLPILAAFLRENPAVNVETRIEELRDLPGLLFSGASDLVLVNRAIEKQGVENHLLGFEEYVLAQSSAKGARLDVYLDHDEEDQTTHDFFRQQSRKAPPLKRNFLGDIYGLIDGVKLGLGRAVVPLHLVEDVRGLEIVKGYAPMKTPVYLSYYAQAFFTRLQTGVIDRLKSGAAERLSQR